VVHHRLKACSYSCTIMDGISTIRPPEIVLTTSQGGARIGEAMLSMFFCLIACSRVCYYSGARGCCKCLPGCCGMSESEAENSLVTFVSHLHKAELNQMALTPRPTGLQTGAQISSSPLSVGGTVPVFFIFQNSLDSTLSTDLRTTRVTMPTHFN
jgi:hypothetical protein